MSDTNANQYFRLFFETAQAILSAHNLQATLNSLVERTVAALQVKAGSLRLIDEQSNSLKLVASSGLSETYLNKGALNTDQSIPEVLSGKPVCIKDAYHDARIQYPEALRAEGLNTLLSVPVIAGGEQVIGVLRLYSAEPRDFNAEDLEFISALAEMGGLAIANARLYQAEGDKLAALFEEIGADLPVAGDTGQQSATADFQPLDPAMSLSYFRIMHEVIRAILSTLDSRQVTQLIVDKVISVMQVKACALRLRNETSQELELIAASGLSEAFLAKGKPHTDQSIKETLAGKPVLIADTANDPRLEYPVETVAEGIASILSLPIMARQRVIGVLRIYSATQRQFSQGEVTFLAALAAIAGVAIMNARMYETTLCDLCFWTATLDYMQD